ncbi:permease [Thermaurantimonas aggregans]|uniref:Permease n=1 Tax=Thermaurantimonas aggregans TaxID=2173829 RepID=A0A401XMV0_9FLAO|nr:DMT family transporter [Thermaurantimonas aggregans]MCX8148114.1 DMT family transporter [Thermaurantimonas aggregans]GCD78340.1 permease [Thermaurantimonas aggregans]
MQKNWVRWLLFAALAMVWGSSFLLMKKGMRTFTYDQMGALRIVFAWILAAVLSIRDFREIKKSDVWPLIWVGLLGNGIPYYLFPLAVKHLDSGLVGIFNSLVPLFTLITGALFFGRIFKPVQVLGVIVGFSGAVLLLFPKLNLEINPNLIYGSLAITSTICYALSINTISSKLEHMRSIAITGLSLSVVGPPSLAYLLSSDFIDRLTTHPLGYTNLGIAAFLGMVNSALAIIVFNQLIKLTSPLFSSSVTYFIPVVALMWGAFDGEQLSLLHIVGVSTILVGVYLVNKRR